MNLSINIKDSYYDQFMTLIKALPKNAIEIINDDAKPAYDDDTLAYMKTPQFQKDKDRLHEALKEIESGKAELLTQQEYDEQMKSFIAELRA